MGVCKISQTVIPSLHVSCQLQDPSRTVIHQLNISPQQIQDSKRLPSTEFQNQLSFDQKTNNQQSHQILLRQAESIFNSGNIQQALLENQMKQSINLQPIDEYNKSILKNNDAMYDENTVPQALCLGELMLDSYPPSSINQQNNQGATISHVFIESNANPELNKKRQ